MTWDYCTMKEKAGDIITIEAYHGTSQACKDSILRTKKINKSSKENEWAGTGIYYFVDENEEDLAEKCILWAKNVKGYKTAAVVKNVLKVDFEKILDLTIMEYRNQFQKYREYLYNKANQYAKKSNRKLKDEYTNSIKLDCLTINSICARYGFDLVKRDAYINFYKSIKDDGSYPRSTIPNAVIASLRNQDCIKEWGECDVK